MAKAEEVASRFSVEVPEHYQPHYNAAPSQLLPVITNDNPKGVSTFYWGLSPSLSNNKAISERIINLRSEAILEKTVYKRALQTRRCLVPADGFYEWKKIGKKTTTPYRFVRKDKELFSFAGIWEEYEDVSGNAFHTFSICTIASNELVSTVHDRMPVILTRDAEKLWVSETTDEYSLMHVLKVYPADLMDAYTVSPRVNSAFSEGSSLILPAPPQDQFGNLTLFG